MKEQFTLKDLREAVGLSRAYVAGRLGVTPNAVTNYESGARRISLEQVLDLAMLYDVMVEDVVLAQINSCQKDQ